MRSWSRTLVEPSRRLETKGEPYTFVQLAESPWGFPSRAYTMVGRGGHCASPLRVDPCDRFAKPVSPDSDGGTQFEVVRRGVEGRGDRYDLAHLGG